MFWVTSLCILHVSEYKHFGEFMEVVGGAQVYPTCVVWSGVVEFVTLFIDMLLSLRRQGTEWII